MLVQTTTNVTKVLWLLFQRSTTARSLRGNGCFSDFLNNNHKTFVTLVVVWSRRNRCHPHLGDGKRHGSNNFMQTTIAATDCGNQAHYQTTDYDKTWQKATGEYISACSRSCRGSGRPCVPGSAEHGINFSDDGYLQHQQHSCCCKLYKAKYEP